MDVHKVATDALGNLMKDGPLEVNSLLTLLAWVRNNHTKDSLEMQALRTALMSADETEDESPAHVAEQLTRLTETLSALSGSVPLPSKTRAWLREVVGDFSALLAQCVRTHA